MGARWTSRSVKRVFWDAVVVEGVSTDEASRRVGVRRSTGHLWFLQAGGMPPSSLSGQRSTRFLCPQEREEIMCGLAAGESLRAIARRLGRAPSTLSREVARNWTFGGRNGRYGATGAQRKAEARACRPKPSKLEGNLRLREHVQT